MTYQMGLFARDSPTAKIAFICDEHAGGLPIQCVDPVGSATGRASIQSVEKACFSSIQAFGDQSRRGIISGNEGRLKQNRKRKTATSHSFFACQ